MRVAPCLGVSGRRKCHEMEQTALHVLYFYGELPGSIIHIRRTIRIDETQSMRVFAFYDVVTNDDEPVKILSRRV